MSSLFGGGGTSAPAGGSSLFGAAPATSAKTTTGNSLFSRIAPAPTSAAPTSSLFGAAPAATSNAAPAGGLFGAKPAQPAASGSSLFGNLGGTPATSAPSGGGLFSNLGGATQTTAPAGGSSMFGGAAAAKPAGGSLFGGNTAQPAQSSLFGGGQAATSAPATSSLFGQSTGGQQQQQGGQQGGSLFGQQNGANQSQLQQSVAPQAPVANPSYFDQLLERSKKRQTEDNVTPFGELPALELGLADISRKVRNLGQGGPSAGLARGGDARAQYLLAASGVNTGQALRDLEKLADGPNGLSDQVADAVTDVKLDLSRKHFNDFQTLVDSRVKRAQDDFNKMIDEQLHDVDWAAQTQRIYEHFGLRKPQEMEDEGRSTFAPGETGGFGRSGRKSRFGATTTNGKSFGVPGLAKSVIGTPGPGGMRESQFGGMNGNGGTRLAPEDRVQRLKQEKYSARVKDLNVARLAGKAFPILDRFGSVETEPTGEDNSMLVHAYGALQKIVGEDASKEALSEAGALKPRQYAGDYLSETATSKGAVTMRKRILDGSRTFLEELYLSQAQGTVSRNPREANVGGVPTNTATIKGYSRFKASRKELGVDMEVLQQIGEDYCWVLIYYFVRCGLFEDALAYVEENQAAFRNIDRRFIGYLRAYVQSPDHRLPPQQQTDINNDYTQRAKLAPEDSIDPYRMACYKVIGRCDLARRSLEKISGDMLDWMWLQFGLAREYSRVDEYSHEAFGLDELRLSFKDIGERYFSGNSDVPNAPTTWFFMQIIAGSFEQAVAHLQNINHISAAHFAIALDYYGLLRVSDVSDGKELLTVTTRQQPQIAFASMIGLYTRDFRTADSTAAVDYIALICLNADLDGDLGKAQRELCHQALTELVLETRDFASLLGDIRTDGQRIPGSIESRLSLIGLDSEEDFMRHITLVAARTAEDQTRTTDAALLFHLAQDYDKVMQIVNQAVSLALTTELGEQPQKLTPLRPRQQDNDQQAAQGSLSLTAVDDPVQLAANFRNLYFSNHQYSSKLSVITRDSCNVLLLLADARNALEQGQWANAIDYIRTSDILPLSTNSNTTAIRAKAAGFNRSPVVLANTIGHAMIWAMIGTANQVAHLRAMDMRTEGNGRLVDEFKGMAGDVMTFAGLIRWKLPGRVWEVLGEAGRSVGL
ncbi:hypothetical protein B0A48_03964 [Cryoendolithus antarcticus]|uniref:Nuclear pore protein n=1 Tax=Cryoendolithus antarcticus TaxID=1507870 RepID=A0A1V8TH27_9PEZI|nr:hypothetical protein B0A48_03964 [Cryoendolithus antarcticus]